MKFIDVSFSNRAINSLKSIVGKKIEKYRTDPYDYVSSVYGIVGVYVDGKVFKLTNFAEQQDHFGTSDDVAVLKFEETEDSDIKTCVEDGKMIDHPVNNEIIEIKIINEEQILKYQNQPFYKVLLTRGIIFVMKDGLEISFEKPVWFSEMIDINRLPFNPPLTIPAICKPFSLPSFSFAAKQKKAYVPTLTKRALYFGTLLWRQRKVRWIERSKQDLYG